MPRTAAEPAILRAWAGRSDPLAKVLTACLLLGRRTADAEPAAPTMEAGPQVPREGTARSPQAGAGGLAHQKPVPGAGGAEPDAGVAAGRRPLAGKGRRYRGGRVLGSNLQPARAAAGGVEADA